MTNKCKPRFPFFNELDKGLSMLVNEVLQHEPETSHAPQISIYELEDAYRVECDLPGVRLEDIELKLENGVLEISGLRHAPDTEGVTVTHDERSFTSFRRRLQLGKDVNAERVDAEFGNGVLRVIVPKSDAVRSHSIQIRSTATEE